MTNRWHLQTPLHTQAVDLLAFQPRRWPEESNKAEQLQAIEINNLCIYLD
jgi:hypothetical protein